MKINESHFESENLLDSVACVAMVEPSQQQKVIKRCFTNNEPCKLAILAAPVVPSFCGTRSSF